MQVVVDGRAYTTIVDTPFTYTGVANGARLFELKYPSGTIEDVIVFDDIDVELDKHLSYLLSEYALVEDETLSLKGLLLKYDVRTLFGLR